MKKIFYIFLFLFLLFFSEKCYAFSYSSQSISFYNSGVTLQKQGKFDFAEQKYLQALKIQPDFIEAKKNLAIIYHNKALHSYSQDNYTKTVEYAKKAISYGLKREDTYTLLAMGYNYSGDLENAYEVYKKVLSIDPENNDAKQAMAMIDLKMKHYNQAENIYSTILKSNPNDLVSKNNLAYVNSQKNKEILNNSINNLPVVPHAPTALYRLIKPSAGITQNTVSRTKNILDLVWSEPNGKILLQELINKKIPITITQGAITANSVQQKQTNTLKLYGIIPIFSYDTSSLSVNIAFNYISDFYNPNIDAEHRIYDLQVFIHEFGHAFMNCKQPNHSNSIEEELGVSMIGLNSAYKIITGQYLDKMQTEQYSMNVLQSLLSDDHNKLPIYSGFFKNIQNYCINLPYPETYSNLPLMYRKLRADGRIAPVQNFYIYGR